MRTPTKTARIVRDMHQLVLFRRIISPVRAARVCPTEMCQYNTIEARRRQSYAASPRVHTHSTHVLTYIIFLCSLFPFVFSIVILLDNATQCPLNTDGPGLRSHNKPLALREKSIFLLLYRNDDTTVSTRTVRPVSPGLWLYRVWSW